jgi:hypothetical protein
MPRSNQNQIRGVEIEPPRPCASRAQRADVGLQPGNREEARSRLPRRWRVSSHLGTLQSDEIASPELICDRVLPLLRTR